MITCQVESGRVRVSKISMAKAAKLFAVSRPTLADHLKKGKISGEKDGDTWKIDMAELQRVYPYRAQPSLREIAPVQHADLSEPAGVNDKELQTEIRVLQAKLEAAEKLAEERGKHLDDLRKLLPGPQDQTARRRWWHF
jgi:excisionase family DNA binding protein